MSVSTESLIHSLNDCDKSIRLQSLRELYERIKNGEIKAPSIGDDVNNHIHTTYSFSPYSPTKAVWMAYMAGLKTSGIMDHDSVGGALEFIEAGQIINMLTTVGCECRVNMENTPLAGRRINNPDQKGIAYVAIHGIPHQNIGKAAKFFAPRLEARGKRNRRMVDNINKIMSPFGIMLNYESDVLPFSQHSDGGSVTERHILYALSRKIVQKFGQGRHVLDFLQDDLKINVSPKVESLLLYHGDPYFEYDLLGALKSDLVEKFYVDATDECPDVNDVIKLAKEIGAISAYAYLGDVESSVTGDKKAQKFEDDYLDELFETITDLGFNAVTYMPSRNTSLQLAVVREYCEKYNLFQISGEDINSPRQKFICEAQRGAEFRGLYDSTLALIAHERMATQNQDEGMFSEKTIQKIPDLNERVKWFKSLAEV